MLSKFKAKYAAITYILLNAITVSLNKYVLAVLNFTVPTVFQGWQTFVCVVMLTGLMKIGLFRLDSHVLDRKTMAFLFFAFVSFSLANVAGSKALAKLPVGIFVSCTNLVPAFLTFQGSTKARKAVSCALLLSAVTLYYFDGEKENKSAWKWLLIHVVFSASHLITINRVALPHSSAVYYCNLSSVVFLLPISIYLQEAVSAIDHARKARSDFFVGCVMSGILGTLIQLLNGHVVGDSHLQIYVGLGKLLTCVLSMLSFSNSLSGEQWCIISFNLILGCLLFDPFHKFQVPDQPNKIDMENI